MSSSITTPLLASPSPSTTPPPLPPSIAANISPETAPFFIGGVAHTHLIPFLSPKDLSFLATTCRTGAQIIQKYDPIDRDQQDLNVQAIWKLIFPQKGCLSSRDVNRLYDNLRKAQLNLEEEQNWLKCLKESHHNLLSDSFTVDNRGRGEKSICKQDSKKELVELLKQLLPQDMDNEGIKLGALECSRLAEKIATSPMLLNPLILLLARSVADGTAQLLEEHRDFKSAVERKIKIVNIQQATISFLLELAVAGFILLCIFTSAIIPPFGLVMIGLIVIGAVVGLGGLLATHSWMRDLNALYKLLKQLQPPSLSCNIHPLDLKDLGTPEALRRTFKLAYEGRLKAAKEEVEQWIKTYLENQNQNNRQAQVAVPTPAPSLREALESLDQID